MNTIPPKYTRHLSGLRATAQVEDEELPDQLQKGMECCWRDELFFDVEIFTYDGSIKAHKIVLASVSPFFKAAFSPHHQLNGDLNSNSINLQIISTGTMKEILNYIYTRKIRLTGTEVEELITAANFLQLLSLERKCSEFIFNNIDTSNFIEIMRFAQDNSLVILEEMCKEYIANHFSLISNTDLMFQLSVDEFDDVLKIKNLVVKDSQEFIPPSSMQEKIMFLVIVRYVEKIYDKELKNSALTRLLQHVRYHLMQKYEFESLSKELSEMTDKELAEACQAVLMWSVDTKPINTLNELRSSGMALPRQLTWIHQYKSTRIAHGFVNDHRKRFSDNLKGVPLYVKGMKMWIRRWDGRPVFGALEVLYSDGSKKFHGERSNYEVYEFVLDADEVIVNVTAYSGYMIDKLQFTTNTGKSYGPYGGDGGGRRVFEHPKKHGYLSYISGIEAFTQGALGIVSLSFHWIYYDLQSEPAVTCADFDSLLTSDPDSDSDLEDSYDFYEE